MTTKTNISKYKEELKQLIKTGDEMFLSVSQRIVKNEKELRETFNGTFENNYHNWYTEAFLVIKQLIPNRLSEFEELYKADKKRKDYDDVTSFSIQDWLQGLRAPEDSYGDKHFNDIVMVHNKFNNQLLILKSAEKRFDSSLFDIKQIVQADLFDSEIEVARELLKKGFLRAAGVICGVIIEKHLAEICKNHNVTITESGKNGKPAIKKDPVINDFNETLKNNGVIEISTWRFIQRLADIRNICGHNKSQEPTKDEVNDLINGTDKVIKTIF